jgi:hypothetical protein
MPALPLKPSTNYTYDAACGIGCGTGNSCPSGWTCDTASLICKNP